MLYLGFGNKGWQPPPSLLSGGQLCHSQGQFILNLMQIVRFSRGACCPFPIWEGAAQSKRGQIAPSPPLDTALFIQENESESVVCKMAAILSRPQYVNGSKLPLAWCWCWPRVGVTKPIFSALLFSWFFTSQNTGYIFNVTFIFEKCQKKIHNREINKWIFSNPNVFRPSDAYCQISNIRHTFVANKIWW